MSDTMNYEPSSDPRDPAMVAAKQAALSENGDFFTANERAQLETLVEDPDCKPGYDYLRGVLAWEDESPVEEDDGTELFWKVVLLQSYRSMMWRPEYHQDLNHVREWFVAAKAAWEKAQASGLRWIGFSPKRTNPANLSVLLAFKKAEFDDVPSSTQTENPRNAFCSSCGTAFTETQGYPRTCDTCGLQIWANPIPVSVVLVPVETNGKTGLLVVRRSIEPRKDFLALVGGFLEEHETWQQGGVREIREETGIIVDPATLEPFWYTSTEPTPNRVLLFSIAKPISEESLVPFTPNHEVSERGLVFGPEGLDELFAFSLHAEAVRRFFRERGVTGNAAYAVC